MSNSEFERIRMVMVNTTHPGNIGAAARAMKNMGLSKLFLVEPKEFPAEKAVWRAAGALDVLEQLNEQKPMMEQALKERIEKDKGLVDELVKRMPPMIEFDEDDEE